MPYNRFSRLADTCLVTNFGLFSSRTDFFNSYPCFVQQSWNLAEYRRKVLTVQTAIAFAAVLCSIGLFSTSLYPHGESVAEPASQVAKYCQTLAIGNDQADALKRACEFSLSAQQKLPNYICDEKVERWKRNRIAFGWNESHDVITAQVSFENGSESYSNIRVNGQAMSDVTGLLSAGEFGMQLQRLFAPENKSKFKFKKEVSLQSAPALLFEFEIRSGDNHSFKVLNLDGTVVRPGYGGLIWIGKSSLRPMRLEISSKPLEFSATVQDANFETDYEEVRLGDKSTFLLPVKSRVNVCGRSFCFRNELEFSDCHKFGAETRIVPMD